MQISQIQLKKLKPKKNKDLKQFWLKKDPKTSALR